MKLRSLGFALLALSLGASLGRTDDKPSPPPLDRVEIDKRIVKIVFDAETLGTDIFNKGNFEGCYRLYQATLMAVQPMLDHRAKLAQSIKDKLDRMRTANSVDPAQAAHALRAILDDVQNDIAPKGEAKLEDRGEPKPEPKLEPRSETKPKTLWDRLGGTAGVKKVVDTVILAAIEDPKVNLFRGKKFDQKDVKALEQGLLEFISSATGGILPYKGKDMKAAHAGMKITDDEFNALAAIVEKTLNTNKVDPADVKELMDLLEKTRKDIVEIKK